MTTLVRVAVGVLVVTVALAVVGIAARAGKVTGRPKILGIAGVEILSTNTAATNLFYGRLVELSGPCNWCESNPYKLVTIPSGQLIGVSPVGSKSPKNLLASVTFIVDNERAMKQWLAANNIPCKESVGPYQDHGSYLSVTDSEGHLIYFRGANGDKTDYAHLPMIHAGFVVKDRATMDKFYKDVLGFRVYWTGGMKDGETDWVDMQVPDGTDWIEYMLHVPGNADQHTLGVMNHIALGVPDVRQAAKQLEANGVRLPEEPKVGRDGKWQLNLYDPDNTRVELMEFTPVEKPCCSEYSGPHPKP
jgi:catechol 2,3-dioxygenase-like lactoylglutathione lyase family enzyme